VYAPVLPDAPAERMLLDFDAGYVRRDGHKFPKQGEARPWRYVQNYLVEIPELAFGDQRRGMAFGAAVELAGARGDVGSDNDDDKVGLTR
ncbi:MAG TPA: NAD(P)/FAD-dependent oxidoreductase, partial [Candidatus Dietzia merdigallinarum]|nr:NAD(P)/FAD-dependent oxidoreductase [Candidatus Dietzia merdigallinarum]